MVTLSPDTDPDVEQFQIERLRQMPVWRKVELAAEMGRAVRTLALAGLRRRHPHDTPAQRRRRLADLMLGPELAARVYGPGPEDRP
jgi:folate-binding Fe-S cluster repair protein YgfZ